MVVSISTLTFSLPINNEGILMENDEKKLRKKIFGKNYKVLSA
jgi:hypothetical protein